ncbi:MAG: hypothetical protein FWC60_10865 [Firmicutes bacterium]|nr:hypothetical protein [Bacillota bacterium]
MATKTKIEVNTPFDNRDEKTVAKRVKRDMVWLVVSLVVAFAAAAVAHNLLV